MIRAHKVWTTTMIAAVLSGCAVYSEPYPAVVSSGYYVDPAPSVVVAPRYDVYRPYYYTRRPAPRTVVVTPPRQTFVPRHNVRDRHDYDHDHDYRSGAPSRRDAQRYDRRNHGRSDGDNRLDDRRDHDRPNADGRTRSSGPDGRSSQDGRSLHVRDPRRQETQGGRGRPQDGPGSARPDERHAGQGRGAAPPRQQSTPRSDRNREQSSGSERRDANRGKQSNGRSSRPDKNSVTRATIKTRSR